MDTDFSAFDNPCHLDERATYPLIRRGRHLALSRVVAGTSLRPPCFAPVARPGVPSGTSNHSFQV